MVLDPSVMNVSISQIVADLDMTVTGVQGAITMYTLVMAAFMLVGAKLGDIWGRDRRRPPHVAARQRDHVVGAAGEDERGRRPPGHGPEPRRLAGDRADRLRAARGLLSGFNDRIAENPALSEPSKTQITAATEQGIEIVTTEQVHEAVLERAYAGRGRRGHGRLRRRRTRRAEEGDARGRAPGLPLDRVHAEAARQAPHASRPRLPRPRPGAR